MRTVEWPERTRFLAALDYHKERHGIVYDSDLAERAAISHSSISNWRRGIQRPSLAGVTAVAAALDVDLSELAMLAGLIDKTLVGSSDMPRSLPEIEWIPVALELNRMLTPGSPLEDEDRRALATIVDRLIAPYRKTMRQRRQGRPHN